MMHLQAVGGQHDEDEALRIMLVAAGSVTIPGMAIVSERFSVSVEKVMAQ